MVVRHLCDPGDLDIVRPLPGRPAVAQRVTAVAVSEGVEQVAVATAAPWFPDFGELMVMRPGSGEKPRRLGVARRAPGAVVRDLVFGPGGGTLTASLGGTEEHHVGQVAHWRLPGTAERWRRAVCRPLYAGYGDVGGLRLAVSADGRTVAGCDQGSRSVLAWAAPDGRQLAGPAGVGGSDAVAVDADGSRVAFRLCRPYERAPRGGIAVFGLRDGAITTFDTGVGWCSGLAFSPDGRHLAVVGSADGTALAVRVPLGPGEPVRQVLAELPGEARQQITRPVWGPAGPRAAVRAGRTVTVWDLAAGRSLLSVPDLGRSTAWALSPDGRALVVATPVEVRAYDLG
ncbi:WD40 repeat domain-containing protein [Streptomyces marincola]|uniref:WD40 repeat domain-containing protein n=1 Tax=Streptomyces marincola TaxID=2878388 RepID=UPI001CF272B3|nr:WD40 repeat domain-containing protein [Streptomyces marincola]UCM90298.1 WD40 repeat domain-containing protein [Streptomyces marincola]